MTTYVRGVIPQYNCSNHAVCTHLVRARPTSRPLSGCGGGGGARVMDDELQVD
jgi:hypothetical protein